MVVFKGSYGRKLRFTPPFKQAIERAADDVWRALRDLRTDSKSNRKVTLTEEMIKSVFHLPISKAATELGVGLTVWGCRVYRCVYQGIGRRFRW